MRVGLGRKRLFRRVILNVLFRQRRRNRFCILQLNKIRTFAHVLRSRSHSKSTASGYYSVQIPSTPQVCED